MAGFKNSLKGVGYFIGAACIAASEDWGYFLALGNWPRVCVYVRMCVCSMQIEDTCLNVLLILISLPCMGAYVRGMYACMYAAYTLHVTMHGYTCVVCLSVCLSVCVCMYVCMYACMYVCIYVCRCVCRYACVRMYEDMYACNLRTSYQGSMWQ